MVTKRIVILGGGTGGTMMANRLRRAYEHAEAEITVVDRDDRHVYQPGLLFVPFGLTDADEITRPRQRQLRDGIRFLEAEIDRVELDVDLVHLGDGATLPYDVLIVATGTRLQPEDTEGMSGPGWMENVFTFYTPEGATALAQALRAFDGGTRGRELRRHADQVPRRPARVLLPRRLVLPRLPGARPRSS